MSLLASRPKWFLCRTPRAVAASFRAAAARCLFSSPRKVSMATSWSAMPLWDRIPILSIRGRQDWNPIPRLLGLLTLLIGAAVSPAAELHTLANKHLTGDLVSVSDKEIVLRIAASEVKTPVGEVLQIDLQRDAPLASGTKYADIEFID